MNKKFEKLLDQIENELEVQSRFGFIVRGSELQELAIENLKNLLIEIQEIKYHYIENKNELCSNTLLAYELFINGVISEIRMLILLKSDKTSLAWNSLVSAQVHIENALRVGVRCEDILTNYSYKLHYIEKLLFPPQIFMSSGFIVEKSSCSICDNDYEDCDHVKGMPYMGEMCIEKIEKISRIEEVSIVDDPADKRCRIIHFEESGKKIDVFTLREIKSEE